MTGCPAAALKGVIFSPGQQGDRKAINILKGTWLLSNERLCWAGEVRRGEPSCVEVLPGWGSQHRFVPGAGWLGRVLPQGNGAQSLGCWWRLLPRTKCVMSPRPRAPHHADIPNSQLLAWELVELGGEGGSGVLRTPSHRSVGLARAGSMHFSAWLLP